MLGASRRLSSFPVKLASSRNLLSRIASAKFSTRPETVAGTQVSAVEPDFSAVELFKNTFSSSGKNIFDVRNGSYVQVTDDEMRLFPEGLAGEILEEFECVDRSAWMIRDGSKLVCRLLDDFVDRKENTNFVMPKGVAREVHIPFFTDRKEWDRSQMTVKHHGKVLTKNVFKDEHKQEMVTTMGDGSVVEQVMANLKESVKQEFPSTVVLTGDRGVGKSVIMNQAVLHARKSGWLTLFIPRGWEQAQGGIYIEPAIVARESPLFDNVLMTVDALRGFWAAHADKLKTIPLKNKKCFDKFAESQKTFADIWARAAAMPGRERMKFIQLRAIIEEETNNASEDAKDAEVLARFDYRRFKPETLEDLLVYGVAFRKYAGEVFIDLIEELKQVDQFPVLIAIDQYNAWEMDSAYSYENRVHSKNLCVPHALQVLPKLHNIKYPAPSTFQLKNGICLLATSLRNFENQAVKYEKSHKHLPLMINVPAFNKMEFLGSVCNLAMHNVISPNIDLDDILAYRMHTASNPRHIRREAVPFFFPRAVMKETGRMSDMEGYATNTGDQEIEARAEALEEAGYDEDDVQIILEDEFKKRMSQSAKGVPEVPPEECDWTIDNYKEKQIEHENYLRRRNISQEELDEEQHEEAIENLIYGEEEPEEKKAEEGAPPDDMKVLLRGFNKRRNKK